MPNKLNFYTEPTKGGFVGRCRELPALRYGPKARRDTALSGAKRMAKGYSVHVGGYTPATGPSNPQPASFKRKVNRITFVLDRSGSMGVIMADAVKALNDNIEAVRAESLRTGQEAIVSVIAFDDRIEFVRINVPVSKIDPVRESEVRARDNTALFDATGRAITTLRDELNGKDEDVSYLVVTITDGDENASNIFSAAGLNQLMRDVQSTDRWTLTFLLPPGRKSSFVSRFAIPAGNVSEWEATARGVQQYTVATNAGIGSYFTSRSAGVNSTKSFYTDLSQLTAGQVKSKLDDLSSQVRVLPVKKEQDIRSFVEENLGTYRPGSAFYQLMKDEKKIQGYKELLVMEKGKSRVYGGDDARRVLGIPDGDLKVKPGNHGNFDLFVQSTSLNRKLVRGTKLLVKTS